MATEPVIMVSACLLGEKCRYDGGAKPVPDLQEKLAGFTIVPFCPELLGGLVAPRPPAEILGGTGEDVWEDRARVLNKEGLEVTAEFRRGAERVLEQVEKHRPERLVFKANSPSCGVGRIYDGSFSGTLRDGDGVTVALLKRKGVARFHTELDLPGQPGQDLEQKDP